MAYVKNAYLNPNGRSARRTILSPGTHPRHSGIPGNPGHRPHPYFNDHPGKPFYPAHIARFPPRRTQKSLAV